MANQNDSFIDEVTQDLRRDRLFMAMRRYGWIVLLLILALVASAGWREYSRNRATAQARAFGDALLTAADAPDAPAALGQVATGGVPGRAGLAALMQADAQLAAGDRAGAAATLDKVGGDAAVPAAIRDLARLKALALQDAAADPAKRDAILSELSAPGAPYRLLALEQKAVALVEAGRTDDAVALIRQIQQEQGLSQNLAGRLSQMLEILGTGAAPAAPDSPVNAPAVVVPPAAAPGQPEAPLPPDAAPPSPAQPAGPATTAPVTTPATVAPAAPAPAPTLAPALAPDPGAANPAPTASAPAAPSN